MPAIKTQFEPRMSEALGLRTISENSLTKKIAKVVASVFVGAGLGAWEYGLSIPFRLPLPLAIVGFIPMLPISIAAAVGGFVYGAVIGVVMTIQAMKQKEPTQEEIRERLSQLFSTGSNAGREIIKLYRDMVAEEGVFRQAIGVGSPEDIIVNSFYSSGQGEIKNLSVHGLAKLLKMCFAKLDIFEFVDLEQVDENSENSLKEMLGRIPYDDLSLLYEFTDLCKGMLEYPQNTKWNDPSALAAVIAPALFPISESNRSIERVQKTKRVTTALIKFDFYEYIKDRAGNK